MRTAPCLLVVSLFAVALGAPEGQQMELPEVYHLPGMSQMQPQPLRKTPFVQLPPVQQTLRQKQQQMLANEEPIVRLQHALLHLLLLGREPRPEDMQEMKDEVVQQLQKAVDAQQLPKLQLEEPQVQQIRATGKSLGRVLKEAADARKEEGRWEGGGTQQLQDPQKQGPQTRASVNMTGLLDMIRDVIRNGNDTLGIPVLDPFSLPHVEVLDLFEEDAWEVVGELSSLEVKGLADLDMTLDFQILTNVFLIPTGLVITVSVTLPEIEATGDYRFDALLGGDAVHLFGSGPFKLTVSEFTFEASVEFGYTVIPPRLTYRGIDLDLGLESLTFSVAGLLEGGLLDDILSMGVSLLGVPVLQILKPTLLETITPILDDLIGSLVEDINVLEVICALLPLPIVC